MPFFSMPSLFSFTDACESIEQHAILSLFPSFMSRYADVYAMLRCRPPFRVLFFRARDMSAATILFL